MPAVFNRCRFGPAPYLRAALAAATLAAAAAGVVWAHPSLVRSEPPANTTLEHAPERVSVWFDEPIEPDYGHLSVFDAQGRRVDNIDVRYVPGPQPGLTATLPPLPRGSYVVVWRAISVGDGHAVGGGFSFGVGVAPDVGAAATAGAQADVESDGTSRLIRYLGLLAQLVFVGTLAFRWLVWTPAVASAERTGVLSAADVKALRREQRRFVTILADVLVAALIIGLAGSLYVQARATGVPFWQLFGTRWGAIWIVRAAAALLAALWLEALLEGSRPAWLGWILAAVLLLTTTMTSHSSAKPGMLGPIVDFAHQLSAGAWLGGLVLLCLSLWALLRSRPSQAVRDRLSSEWVARFSGMAAASVGLLLASGFVLGLQQVQSWSGLLLTSYGEALVVKLALVVVALAIAAYNSLNAERRVVAGVRGRGPLWIALESGAVAAAVFVAALMTDLPPAYSATAAAQASRQDQPLVLNTKTGTLSVEARVEPARLGANVYALRLLDDGSEAVRGAGVELFFQPVGGGALTSRLGLAESSAADGRYAASGAGLTRQGPWQVLVTITPPGATAPVYANFDLEVGFDNVVRAAGQPVPRRVRAVAWLNQFGRPAVSVLALALVVGWVWIVSRRLPGLRRLVWLAVGLLVAATVWLAVVGLNS